jgi:predicted transposase YbfD/YdcC
MNNVFIECFGKLKDPRVDRSKKHHLIDIIALVLFAIMSGAQTYDEIEDFGKLHEEWLKRYLRLPNGIPSHDTLNRTMAVLDPEMLQQSFLEWIMRVKGYVNENVVAIDGKTIRHSRQNSRGTKPLHLLNAYSCANGLSLGQLSVDGKTNEITVIPELIKQLALDGAIVTIDAMGCQTNVAEIIVKKKRTTS